MDSRSYMYNTYRVNIQCVAVKFIKQQDLTQIY